MSAGKGDSGRIIDKDKDSLRFYYLGDNYKNKVEHIAQAGTWMITETLFI